MNSISFTVPGIAVPQGSMMAFTPRGWKRPIITSANPKLKKWRKLVHDTAVAAMGWTHPAGNRVPLMLELTFVLPRAKSNKFLDAVKKPDLDKLVRGIGDSLSKVVYEDDSQIVELHASKYYGAEPRVEIMVSEVGLAPVVQKRASIKDKDIPF